MTNNILQKSKENPSIAKRKRVLAAVAEEIVTSEDDDNVADGVDICNIEKQTHQCGQTATSSALQALGETIKNTLLEINEIREQNRERRHRELLLILKKMVQQESTTDNETTDSKITNLSNDTLNHEQNIHTNQYVAEQDFLREDLCNSDAVANNSTSSITFGNNLDQSLKNSSTTAENSSSAHIKLLHKSQVNIENTDKLKGGAAVTHDTKKELQKMRARMLEIQRQKMEDRERKKREFVQMQAM